MTTKKQAERCVTHHHACDCREYRYERMESALKVIRTWAAFDSETAVAADVAVALDCVAVVKLCDRALGHVR